MGKQGQCKAGGSSKTYVLKLDMHCQCYGCVKKIKDGVKEMSLSQGVERADVSAETETGEVRVRVTGGVDMDPLKLCCLLQEATKKKCVRILLEEEESVPSTGPGRIARPGQTNNTSLFGQVSSDWVAPEAAGGWRRHGAGTFHATAPSAPPLPLEEQLEAAAAWSETTAPSERCRYRWAAPGSTLGVWAASEITGTLAMYEL
ncbi:uncharacterized protein LOC110435067 isoform X3 [Sorghum bicolor]|uniref:uncharacterized protein LOC110435067 isoform X3 n=1 Tax=Sorghum bicolor TaxID=4558 RepID=UPI000B42465F|nr:uncharacterized protein LOC110435067 isoform X3 [Sorghum bicolor]|eukprot:XP_021316068.1 uncharacterized protein LOC110435067 isoform X3 [Sorghum bicolor]